MAFKKYFFCTLCAWLIISVKPVLSQVAKPPKSIKIQVPPSTIIPGAARTDIYLELIKDKRVGLVINQSSTINVTPLLDTLLRLKINVVKILAPEHGFRGTADAGESIANGLDTKTKIPIVSLYGDHKQPSKQDLSNIDVLVFDLQDVGVRFYTYVGTLHYVMLAAALNNKELIVLDRPNPNGFYVDGPLPEKNNHSFVCMHPVPVVHGLTIAEYAQMINGEHWIEENDPKLNPNVGDPLYCNLTVVPCKFYNHTRHYTLPIKPSPNLPNSTSIYLYPQLCWFEGTVVSLGRGTDKPFQQFGHPKLQNYSYSFIPKPTAGAKNPPCNGEKCFGRDLSEIPLQELENTKLISLSYLLEAYKNSSDKSHFFNPFFSVLAGGKTLQEQIEKGMTESEIRKTWEPALAAFKIMRKRYLLYPE